MTRKDFLRLLVISECKTGFLEIILSIFDHIHPGMGIPVELGIRAGWEPRRGN